MMRSQVLSTSYTMKMGPSGPIDYTEAKVRVRDKTIHVRVGGFKADEKGYPALIEAAEERYAAENVNGSAVI